MSEVSSSANSISVYRALLEVHQGACGEARKCATKVEAAALGVRASAEVRVGDVYLGSRDRQDGGETPVKVK
jgi:hypothetical protein